MKNNSTTKITVNGYSETKELKMLKSTKGNNLKEYKDTKSMFKDLDK